MHISHVKWQEGLPEPGISTWDQEEDLNKSQGEHTDVPFPENCLSGVPWAPDIWDIGPRHWAPMVPIQAGPRRPHSHTPKKGEAPKETRAHPQGSAALS